jgi:UDP-2-acetamido-3-amino-2,3-dideoxy-glucuronate N-acetyltransferase
MIKLALIGPGKWGVNYLNTIKEVKDAKIKYICARTQETLNNFSNEYKKTTNYEKLFNYHDLDGVILATPASTHFEIAAKFIKARLPILVEKPLTISYKEALELKNMAVKYRTLVKTGHIYIYHPAIIKMKQLLPNIGKLIHVETQGGNFGPFRSDVSTLWDWAPHDISLYLYLIEKYPLKIQSWGEKYSSDKQKEYDNIQFRMVFPGGITGFSSIGRMFPLKRRNLLVIGNHGALFFDDTQIKKLAFYSFSKDLPGMKIDNFQYPVYDKKLPLKKELEAFITQINIKDQSNNDIEFALQVAKITHQIENKLKLNKLQD